MPNRHRSTWLAAVTLATLLLPRPSLAQAIELVESDERGATLRLVLPAYELKPSEVEGRFDVAVTGMRLLDQPGRPRLPYASALLAVPAGVRVSGRVIEQSADEERTGVAVAIGERPTFAKDDVLGWVPTSTPEDPVADGGEWPGSIVAVGSPFVIRGQRMVAVNLQPFRYDERDKTLRVVRRSRFGSSTPARSRARPPPAEDRHWEPVLQGAVLNYQQGRRGAPAASRPARRWAGSLFESRRARWHPRRGAASTRAIPRCASSSTRPASTRSPTTCSPRAATRPDADRRGERPSPRVHRGRDAAVRDHRAADRGGRRPNGNGTFDSGDRIMVWVQNWAERSRATRSPQRALGRRRGHLRDARGRARGCAWPTRAGWRDVAGLTPLSSYPRTRALRAELRLRRRSRRITNHSTSSTGPEPSPYYHDRPDTFRFETSQLDHTRPAWSTMTLAGRLAAGSALQLGAGAQRARPVHDGGRTRSPGAAATPDRRRATSPGYRAQRGRGQRLGCGASDRGRRPIPRTNSCRFVRLNWFDVTYWRSYRALAGCLPCNSGDATGQYEIACRPGFTDRPRSASTTSPTRPTPRAAHRTS